MNISRNAFIIILFFTLTIFTTVSHAQKGDSKTVTQLSSDLLFGGAEKKTRALQEVTRRGKQDVIATLILALRYQGPSLELVNTLQKLTGDNSIKDWNDAMLWQEAHPEVIPHESFRSFKLLVFNQIDPQFMRFLGQERALRKNMKIRLEEITWGGVQVDGIPSLDNPKLIAGKDALYLKDDDLVFGVSINNDIRAYPLRIMGWHEMFNETIGGVPVALAYCTLCGSGILFETHVKGRDKPLIFGSSGFLYRSNKLMFDRETDSLWNQFTGEPVSGPLVNSGIKLKIRPVLITSWKDWKTKHPETKVLSLDTGHRRNYGSGVVYNEYFASPDLMFPTIVKNEDKVRRKDYVFGIRTTGTARAWPLAVFKQEKIINDVIGDKNIVLIGNAETRSVSAYERGEHNFTTGTSLDTLNSKGKVWSVKEDHLLGPDNEKLSRLPGHIAYWFAWDGYMGVKSTLYDSKKQ
ncbi:MAG: DUF3179 domain-containing protein [Methyloligellaceae bacterium]